jgi:sulfate permease, SulP family
MLAGVSVALVLIPQSLAYAEIAGLDPAHGLYAAAAAPLAGALVGSSPYLQTGPVAVTSLLTFGALSALAEPFTARFALLAGMLAILVGLVRLAVGMLGGGPVAYLMSRPVVTSFTTAAAVLIMSSQVPSLLGVQSDAESPLVGAIAALADPLRWSRVDVLLGAGALVLMLAGRRLTRLFPAALLAVVAATTWSALTDYRGHVVGQIELALALPTGLPLGESGQLLLPAVVIALVGFAEPAAIARRYAAEDRRPWNANREFVGQGLANVASGAAGGYPVGGSFSRTALNRLGGATSRWSGVFTGATVLVLLPTAQILAPLPTAVLAGLVIAAVTSLVDVRAFVQYWRWSRPQFAVATVTAVATLLLAPRVERGVLVGVGLALAVHLWRELKVRVPSSLAGDTLHLWPSGVLYFASAPGLERTLHEIIARHPEVDRALIHLGGLGRLDLTGALTLRDIADEAEASGIEVEVEDMPDHVTRLLDRVLSNLPEVPGKGPATRSATGTTGYRS